VVKFEGVLTPTSRGGGGTLIAVPREIASVLGLRGMPRIQARIAGHAYRGSLMPMGDGTYCLGVLKSIQEAAGVRHGDTISVELEIDTLPRTVEVPADLASELARDSALAARWEGLSYTDKKEIVRSLQTAKKAETRVRRLAATLEKLRT